MTDLETMQRRQELIDSWLQASERQRREAEEQRLVMVVVLIGILAALVLGIALALPR